MVIFLFDFNVIEHPLKIIVCIIKQALIKFTSSISSKGGRGMENTAMMKGIALFATLTGIYQWVGNGTSLYDIMIILIATFLVISMEPHVKEEVNRVTHEEIGDNPRTKHNLLNAFIALAKRVPLREWQASPLYAPDLAY